MKTKNTDFIVAGGVDKNLNAPPNLAENAVNLRYNSDLGCWVGDRSFQPWWQFPSSFTVSDFPIDYTKLLTGKVDSFYFWKKKNSGEVYVFIEQSGILYYVLGNKKQGSGYVGSYYGNDVFFVQSNRHVPKINEIGTRYIPYGNKLLIINGVDKPILFSGAGDWRDFSFTISTPSLNAIPIQSSYIQGDDLAIGTGAPTFTKESIIGLGDTTGDPNNYFYKMAYVTEDGALSPFSSEVRVGWTVDQPPPPTPVRKFGITIQTPICPPSCTSRILYRTKNVKSDNYSGSTFQQYYFLKEIRENCSDFFIDVYSDTFLVTEAPSITASSVISTEYKYGDSWDGRIWLGKGQKIIYSEKGIPEQFGAISYFDLGNTVGGDITEIKAYYNNLIVFREHAINVIRSNSGVYTLATLSSNIGTTATNSIVLVPSYGLVFANEDAVWSLNGGLDGGSQINVVKISDMVNKEWKTLTVSAIRKCIAAYSPTEREYWLHYPGGSADYPNKGLVLHTDTPKPSWTFRKAPDKSFQHKFTFSAMGNDLQGRFVFGSIPQWSALTEGASTSLLGPLHVWCASTFHSQVGTVSSVGEDSYTITTIKDTLEGSYWESSWIQFDLGTVRVFSVELDLIAYGDTKLDLYYAIDYSLKENQVTGQKMTESKVLYTAAEPPVTVGATYTGITKNPFTVNTSQVQDTRKIRLRYDVNTELCNQFRFYIIGQDVVPFQLIGYRLNVSSEATPLLNQNINMQKGQAR